MTSMFAKMQTVVQVFFWGVILILQCARLTAGYQRVRFLQEGGITLCFYRASQAGL